jgi:hypothetical protein
MADEVICGKETSTTPEYRGFGVSVVNKLRVIPGSAISALFSSRIFILILFLHMIRLVNAQVLVLDRVSSKPVILHLSFLPLVRC